MSKKGHNGAGPVVEVYDTTLRDGTQMGGHEPFLRRQGYESPSTWTPWASTSSRADGQASNPKDVEFFERARDIDWRSVTIAAFGSTCRAQLRAEDDPQLRTLLDAETPVCTIFGKTWDMHVQQVLRTTLEENLRMIEESVVFLSAHGRRVIYDAEHFFDGYKADDEYALDTLRAAARAGAETLVLCDTNGGSMPWEIEAIVQTVRGSLPDTRIGIHAHNDGECGVANSVSAVRAGARHVQGTINGYGERCGNANLCSMLPDIELKLGLQCLPKGGLRQLYDLSHFVAEIANLSPNDHAAYVGRSAFAHKGGVHVSAIRRHRASYEHVDPTLVGNESRVVVSELSGRSNVLSKAEELGLQFSATDGGEVLEKIKELESKGFAYEAAEASVALLMAREQPEYRPPFEVLHFQAGVGRREGGGMFAEATVKVRIGDELVHTAGEGNGPVSALDSALRKALQPFFPEVSHIHLSGLQGSDPGRSKRYGRHDPCLDRQSVRTRFLEYRGGVEQHHRGVSPGADRQYRVRADARKSECPSGTGGQRHMKSRITLLPGDGIGPEIIEATRQVLESVARKFGHSFVFSTHLIGGIAIDETGVPLPDDTIVCVSKRRRGSSRRGWWTEVGRSHCERPAGARFASHAQSAEAVRKRAPSSVFRGLEAASPLKAERLRGVDLVFIRELTGGIYFGQPKGKETRDGRRTGFDTMVYDENEIRRIVELAFNVARKRRKLVTSIDKANVLETMQVWREIATEVGKANPDVRLQHQLVDSAAMRLVTEPSTFDVIVSGNMFGDILSDEGAVLTGSLGLLPSASLGEGDARRLRAYPRLGARHRGQGHRESAGHDPQRCMLLRHSLNLDEEAQAVENAVQRVLDNGLRTTDLGGGRTSLTTTQMAHAVMAAIEGA